MKILQVAASGPWIRDTLEIARRKFAADAIVVRSIARFRNALLKGIPVAFQKEGKEQVYLPVAELQQRQAVLSEAIKEFASALR